MLNIYSCCFCYCIALVVCPRVHENVKTTTSTPVLSLFDKFHQSDYKLTFEWAEVDRVNKHFCDYNAIVFKHNRTTTAINFTLIVYADVDYDVEVIVQMYKFASNEYRLFPMRFQVNFCEALKKDLMGTATLAEGGNMSCPLLKGRQYNTFNWKPDGTKLPPFVPTGRYMMELQYLYHSTEILVTKNYGKVYRPFTIYED